MIKLKEVSKGLVFFKGNDGQQGVACERQIQSGVGPAMAVTVFLPRGSVALVVIAVFNAPVLTRGASRARFLFTAKTGEEDALMALCALGIAFLGPLAKHGHYGARAGEPGCDRGNGFNRSLAGVDASVFAFCAQVKKGVFFKALTAALSLIGVFSLVPRR
jgi:hypothetical protein